MSNRGEGRQQLAVAEENKHLTWLYARLDELRERAKERRKDVLSWPRSTPQAQLFRDEFAAKYTQEIARLTAIDHGLCFGRIDLDNGETRYIGRMGILDEDGNPILIDWRAQAARPFYLATAVDPHGVRMRRHIRTHHRTVIGVEDEVLDLDAPRGTGNENVSGEAALLASINASRTGRMSDIVATIQAEQDRIIRAEADGALVVQGGPGTGKTAVALHRAAYLLYEYRERLANRGVLIIGPNPTFLRYISDVLPGLAETDVLLRTMSDLYPGTVAEREETDRAAGLKGDLAMVDVMDKALADRQRAPERAVTMDTEYGTLTLDHYGMKAVRSRGRGCGRKHNAAREKVDDEIVALLAEQVADDIGQDPLGGDNLLEPADVDQIASELRNEPEVQAVADWLWPVLTPHQLLAGLLGTPERIKSAAPHLSEDEVMTLLRQPRTGWTVADIPLLDEAAQLLGYDDNKEARDQQTERLEQQRAYAEGVLEIVQGSRSTDLDDDPEPEQLMATDVLDAALLGERYREVGYQSIAARAAKDREWTFGHVIVDEAQELSPMAWRMLARRSVGRSMTIVGDLTQASSTASPRTWAEALEPYAHGRWREAELTVSYRTPAEILDVAADTLAKIDPTLRVPAAVRATGVKPWRQDVQPSELSAMLARAVDSERARIPQGQVGVLAPTERVTKLAETFADTPQVSVVSVREAKGLEYDSVIVVDPDGIVGSGPRGLNDLYVAQTRATQRMGTIVLQ